MPKRCKWFGHKMRRVRMKGNLLSTSRVARHTSYEERKCARCPYTDTVEHFHSWSYWADFDRERRVEEIAEGVRRGKRYG